MIDCSPPTMFHTSCVTCHVLDKAVELVRGDLLSMGPTPNSFFLSSSSYCILSVCTLPRAAALLGNLMEITMWLSIEHSLYVVLNSVKENLNFFGGCQLAVSKTIESSLQ